MMYHGLNHRAAHAGLLLLCLAWMGTAYAKPPLRLALAEPPVAVWQAPAHHPISSFMPTRITPWIRIHVDPGDTLSGLFDNAGLTAGQWRSVLALGDTVDALRHLQPGDKFRLRKTPDGRLATLHFRLNATDTLVIRRTGDGLTAKIAQLNATSRHVLVSGMVAKSFPKSLQRAGVPSKVATELAHVFMGRKNLSRTMSSGDQFSIIYEARFADGERIAIGPIIAASIHTDGQSYRVFRHIGPDGDAGYYNSRGQPYKPSIERTPLNYLYVSSPFDRHRMNPVLHVIMPHTGVDLAAPKGTPVHAAADGTVTLAGWVSGYGRLIEINHAMGYQTRYGHLSRYADGLDVGDHVEQGEVIGYVGMSGRATGYHLHYEIRKNGTPYPPLTMKLPSGKPLTGAQLTAFTNRIQPLIARLSGSNATPHTLIAANPTIGHSSACVQTGTVNSLLALAPGQVQLKALDQVFCTITG